MSKSYFFFGRLHRDEAPVEFVPLRLDDLRRKCATPSCENVTFSFMRAAQCGDCLRAVMREIFRA